ncbi:MAG TPA: hypothetical protein VF808_08220 [Ktedonobacterales bacterium]
MSMTSRFRPGDIVRTYRWAATAMGDAKPWRGKVIAVSADGQALAVVDLSITLPQPQYLRGAHVVRAVGPDEVYLVRKVGGR